MRKSVSDITYDKPLNRDDEQGPIFEAAKIARLLKVREKEVPDGESEDENCMCAQESSLHAYRTENGYKITNVSI
jgi:hypothetical protein